MVEKHHLQSWQMGLVVTLFLALTSFTFACVVIGMQVLNLPVKQIGANILSGSIEFNTVMGHGQTVVDKAGDMFDAISRPCGTKDVNGALLPCGTLADFNKTMNTTRYTIGTVNTAAIHETHNLDVFDAQEKVLFGDAHRLIGNLNKDAKLVRPLFGTANTLLDSANTSVLELRPQTKAVLSETEVTIDSFNKISANPEIPQAIHNVHTITENAADVSELAKQKAEDMSSCSVFKMLFNRCNHKEK